jgi:peptidoglycan hydrolase-like protein with peptidoglycan-binding domain
MQVPGVPYDQCSYPGRDITVIGGVLHRTYGGWGGDYSVGKNNPSKVGFHFLIGKEEGRWVQFNDTNRHCNHAPGANLTCVGIEFTGRNEEPLTDWQVRAGAWIIGAVSHAHGIPLDYYNGSRRTPVAGWTTHASVYGSDHSDTITRGDWDKMAGLIGGLATPAPPAPPPANIDWAAVRRMAAAKLLNDGLGSIGTLRQGSSGRDVMLWQEAINLITSSNRIKVDGAFGPGTRSETVNFQTLLNLSRDGVVGPQTKWWATSIVQNIRDGKA